MNPLQLSLEISVGKNTYILFIHAYKGEPQTWHYPGEPPSWEIVDVVREDTHAEVPYSLWSSFELLYKDQIEEAIRDEVNNL